MRIAIPYSIIHRFDPERLLYIFMKWEMASGQEISGWRLNWSSSNHLRPSILGPKLIEQCSIVYPNREVDFSRGSCKCIFLSLSILQPRLIDSLKFRMTSTPTEHIHTTSMDRMMDYFRLSFRGDGVAKSCGGIPNVCETRVRNDDVAADVKSANKSHAQILYGITS